MCVCVCIWHNPSSLTSWVCVCECVYYLCRVRAFSLHHPTTWAFCALADVALGPNDDNVVQYYFSCEKRSVSRASERGFCGANSFSTCRKSHIASSVNSHTHFHPEPARRLYIYPRHLMGTSTLIFHKFAPVWNSTKRHRLRRRRFTFEN